MTHVGRATSPDTARGIWSQIDQLKQVGKAATVEAIAEAISHYFNWNIDEVRVKIYEAADCGVIQRSASTDPNAPSVFSVPSPDLGNISGHDWYCFECHGSGIAIPCSTCFRIYHHSCLSVPVVNETNFVCPVCQSVEAPCAMEEPTLTTHLDSILTWVHRKGGEGFALPQGSVDLTPDQYRLLIARDIDLCAIKTNMNTHRYPTPRHFLADIQLLIHNICILHGKNGNLSRLGEQLLKEVKEEIIGFESDPAGASLTYLDSRGSVKRPAVTPHKLTGSTPKREKISVTAIATPKAFGDESLESWPMNEDFKKLLMDLQRHWLIEYQQSREKLLVELTEKLHQEFLSDQQKIRTELLTQFRDELDATRTELEGKYKDTLKQEILKMGEKHKKDLSNTKKKQWCWQCEAEAIYHCCWNTAYCSVDCQQAHWPTHRKYCRRKKGASAGMAGLKQGDAH